MARTWSGEFALECFITPLDFGDELRDIVFFLHLLGLNLSSSSS